MPVQSAASARVRKLVTDLDAAATALIAVLEGVDVQRWMLVPAPGAWSIGKEAAHVAEAAAYHQWIVRLTIGEKVSTRRPAIERQELTTALMPKQAIDLVRQRTAEGGALIQSLSDDQLDLPTRPPRPRASQLGETIEHVLIGHYDVHRREIERKLRNATD
jgi:hypothetical protein